MNNAQTFSINSGQYAKNRPQYPEELFSYLSNIVSGHEQAWDCATGNGQAAISLANHFLRVEATDISEEQISHALTHDKVRYSVSPAEHTLFNNSSFDLICVAQAIHWFDQPKFFTEAARLLKPGGILAVWGYAFLSVNPEIDKIIETILLKAIDTYWAEENRQIMNGYRTLSLPFEKINIPRNFSISVNWSSEQTLEYMKTWSAVKRYTAEKGQDPITQLRTALKNLWEPGEIKTVNMPISIKVSKKEAIK